MVARAARFFLGSFSGSVVGGLMAGLMAGLINCSFGGMMGCSRALGNVFFRSFRFGCLSLAFLVVLFDNHHVCICGLSRGVAILLYFSIS